ncbi:MAG: ABC transporter ATP-binding protein [Acidobacteriota bacterium]
MKALEVNELTKSFRSNFLFRNIDVLRSVNINVEEGSIYGFLGPNGAGKTTTIKCILGLIFPDSGSINVFGKPVESFSYRNKIGFLPESPYYYDYLTARETLRFSGRLFSIPGKEVEKRSDEILKLVGLNGKENIKLKKFSKGMLQRIGLAQALINDPHLVILDEPFTGLDPMGRKELRDIIIALKAEGRTVFFSSHILQDMEMIVDDVGIIVKGRISKEGKLRELVGETVKYHEITVLGLEEHILKEKGYDYTGIGKKIMIKLEDRANLNDAFKFIEKSGGECISVSRISRTLEDIFIQEIEK